MVDAVRTVFMGSSGLAEPTLQWLAENPLLDLCAVYTQPDKPHGRGMKLRPGPVKVWAEANRIPVRQPTKLGPEEEAWLEGEGIALILVLAYGHILKRSLLKLPRFPVLNLHGSLLPRYRGASPINAAIAMGDTESGVCLMEVTARLDAGAVADCEVVALDSGETAGTLAPKLGAACPPLLERTIPALLKGTLEFTPQDEAAATYTRLLGREDAMLDFRADAVELDRRRRALTPWPGAAFRHGESVLRVGAATAVRAQGEPGTVLAADASGVLVACGEGGLLVQQLQRPGGRLLEADAFLRGYPLAVGERLPLLEMAPLVGPAPFKFRPAAKRKE